MKKLLSPRFLSGAAYFALMLPVFYYSDTPVLSFAIAAVSVGCVYDALHVTGSAESKLYMPSALVFAAVYPFLPVYLPGVTQVVIYVYLLMVIVLYILHFDAMKLANAVHCGAFSVMLPVFIGAAVMSRQLENGLYYLVLTFVGVWVSDTMAQVSGKLFGKHKLGSAVSPNKTVEGCVGSVVCTAAVFAAAGFVINTRFGLAVSYTVITALGVLVSIVAQFGDLLASAVKRAYGVKDYSRLIPGHGGMYDRFDSFALVAPLIYFVASLSGFIS
ncbi:MAG TPA: phosphatidate cytidylyltransferase [Terriglobales bacterium]|nr:phosphatidate cytidylyltransferase [Terriglobales bacterium]